MSFVNIRVTTENGEPTKQQRPELIAAVTDLIACVLHKNKAPTLIMIDEIHTDNYRLGGGSITEVRKNNPA